jgi:uncharacterized protein
MRPTRQSLVSFLLLGVLVLAGLGYVLVPFLNERSTPDGSTRDGSTPAESTLGGTSPAAPVFVKEGEVTFLRNGAVIRKIDVEIAENDAERAKGLMYRPYLPDSVGMLFIFDRAEPQAFWMKNTAIPLDIIYVDENRKVVSIQKNTTPYSEQSLPSYQNAQFVVEVNAGFTDRHGIREGDTISF